MVFVDKDKDKNSLSFQLTDITGKIPKLKIKKSTIFSQQELDKREKDK